jgi:hypothetical protein
LQPNATQLSSANQRIIVRCDSLQNAKLKEEAGLAPSVAQNVDIVPINMSACIFDMKAPISSVANNHVVLTDQMLNQYQNNNNKQNRRLQSSNVPNGVLTHNY